MNLFKELATLFMATEATPLRLHGVEFWIDQSGPWQGQLVFFPATAYWNAKGIGEDVDKLAKVYPEVGRIVARYAEVTR